MRFIVTFCMYLLNWTIFWQQTDNVQQNIFEKPSKEVGSSQLYASIGTFCAQIGQFLEPQWVFRKCLKTVKSLFSKENDVDFEFFRKFKISLFREKLTNLNTKGVKRSVKMWATNLYEFFQKYFLVHDRLAVKKSFLRGSVNKKRGDFEANSLKKQLLFQF